MKYKEIEPLRTKLLLEQNNNCLLCNHPIEPGQEVLDHCHKNGTIRGVLHSGCNMLLGKLENSMVINRITPTMLVNICDNLEQYIQIKREEVHPRHLTKLRNKQKKALSKKKSKGISKTAVKTPKIKVPK